MTRALSNLWVEEESDAPIDLPNGVPDRQGFGLFARAGLADEDTNPIEWSASGGLGGRGVVPTRDDDVFGLGYYYTRLQDTRISGLLDADEPRARLRGVLRRGADARGAPDLRRAGPAGSPERSRHQRDSGRAAGAGVLI